MNKDEAIDKDNGDKQAPSTLKTPRDKTITTDSIEEAITELSEDMEMVGPGSMLCEARKALSLSQEHIANKLNFKISLVKDIELDQFDPSMPVTFNRGYLANYAKLVGVDVDDVLAAYDALDAASIQRSEMLSFSKQTSKQAEHSRVMWLSYLIVAVLVGLTFLWWLQESKQEDSQLIVPPSSENALQSDSNNSSELTSKALDKNALESVSQSAPAEVQDMNSTVSVNVDVQSQEQPSENDVVNISDELNSSLTLRDVVEPAKPVLSTAVFTFKGDCWVNISDATGERVAWGVKTAGYVMTIEGVAPLQVTVGKPELTSITFDGETVDMSDYSLGNIAKFSLPISKLSEN